MLGIIRNQPAARAVALKLLTTTLTAAGLFALPSMAGWNCWLRFETPFDPAYYPAADRFTAQNCRVAGGNFVTAAPARCHTNAAGNCPEVFLKVYHPLLSAPNKPDLEVRVFYECKQGV
ncbi:hypothetical protein EG328_000498 [Venturia inaequalis]|uniref:Uncharacterized protein n=1 Tax=Venturia inaequalis TaxID=5025 RepID=A0A8H3Z1R2_VENIN|nr:hypothetical protein EG328_000498 [Venturia inaequalis]